MGAVNYRYLLRREFCDVAKFSDHWPADAFHQSRECDSVIQIACVDDDNQPIGVLVYDRLPTQLVILHMAVAVPHRRKGVASGFIHRLKSRLNPGKRTAIKAVLSSTNKGAELFLRSHGFVSSGPVYGCDDLVYSYDLPRAVPRFRGRNRITEYVK